MSSRWQAPKLRAPDHPKRSLWGYVHEHILIAEKALGHYLSDNVEVHHVDGNPRNNANSNLVICENKKYHRLLHSRQRTLTLGGDPNTQKFCAKCKTMRLQLEFHANRTKPDVFSSECRFCCCAYQNLVRARNKRLAQ